MSLRFYGGTAALPLKHSLGVVMVLLDDPSLPWQHMSRNPDTPCPLWLMTHTSVSFLPCLASFLSQLISFLWLLLSPPNTHQHILTQIRTLEGPGLYPWGKVALEEFRESTLKPCAEWPLPIGRVGIRPLNIELKDEASLPTIHSTISLHLTPKTPMWKEKYYNF